MMKYPLILLLMNSMAHSQYIIDYTLSMSRPTTHLFEVGITVRELPGTTTDLHMPAWRTGRYAIQDFSGGVQEFSPRDDKGNMLPWKKIDKDTWRIEHGRRSLPIIVSYKVYANEFNQRTRELNNEHGFLDPAAVFMYVDELKWKPLRLTVHPFDDWHVTTGLEETNGQRNVFTASNYEYFADCPIEIGRQKDFEFKAEGKRHIISIYGEGNWHRDTLVKDFSKIIKANKDFWGTLPYEKFVFQIHCQPNAGGGTEHINSTIMGVRPFIFSNPGTYKGFLGLVSHEFFHTWNVKQLRPKAFTPYDFSKEGYSEELWISEGATSYFDDLILIRAGIRDAQYFTDLITQMIRSDRSRHGNTIQPLSEASFDAWIKYWKRRQNAGNAESDYYEKGQHVSLLLDLEIRHRSDNTASFEKVMKTMFERFPLSKGFTNADLIGVCEEVTGDSLKKFFDDYLYGTAPLAWEKSLSYAGLEVKQNDASKTPGLGISLQETGERVRVTSVFPNSPAEKAGIEINDEILAVNGFRARGTEINDRVASGEKGDIISLTIFRNDRLKEIAVTLDNFQTPSYTIKKISKPSKLQRTIYEDWLKEPF